MLPDGKVRLVYRVADTGLGMSEEFQAEMYNMFARETDSRINNTQGTGLGLAIVKQMVDLMKGTITCDSALGEGTTFTVTLDLEKSSAEECQHLYPTDEPNGDINDFDDIRVMVAEDNDLILMDVQMPVMNAHIAKPVDIKKVLEVLRQVKRKK